MDRHHKNQKLNIDDMADLSLDEILSDFNLDKLGFGHGAASHSTAELQFGVPKFAFDEEDSDMKLYSPPEEVLPEEDYESYGEEDFHEPHEAEQYEQDFEATQLYDVSLLEGDYGYEAGEEYFEPEYLPEENASVPAVESFDFEEDFYGDDGYARSEDDEYIIEDKPKRSSGSRAGFFNIFKKRSSGSIGAMEDEARSLAQSLKKEKAAKKPRKQEEEDFDLYMHLDELADINAREAEAEDYDPLPPEEEYYDEDSIVEEFSEEEYAPEEAFAQEYTEEDFRAEFDDLPDFEDEDNYYEEPEHYHSESGSYEYGLDMGIDADPTSYAREDKRYSYTPVIDDEIEIDSRFNLSGKRKVGGMVYGDLAVDQSADEGYQPTVQTGYSPSQWTPEYDDPVAEKTEETEAPRKKHKFVFGKKKKKAAEKEEYDPYGGTAPADGEVLADFDDADAAPADYAEGGDYGDGKRYEEEDMYFPPTFREYVLSIFASMFLRVRGSVRGDTVGTMDDTEEDLGAELSPAAASKYYGSFVKSFKLRLRISYVLLAILCYVSLELPVFGMLKTLPVAAAFCFALQSAIMLLALDVVTTGVLNACRLKIGADSLAVLACLITGIDAMVVAISPTAALHMPLCAVSSCSVVGLLLAASLHARGMRKSLRVPAIGKRFYAVTGELKNKNKELTLLKSLRSYNGFVRRSEEAAPDETAFIKLGIPIILLSLLLAIITAAVKKSFADFIYIYSAFIAAAVPFTALISYTLPFFLGATRIFRSGSAIAGWSGLCDIGTSRNIIITDRDLFPESAITMDSVRIFADEDAQKVISYAGSMMQASGACSAACFMELMEENDCDMKPVTGFEFLPGGGMRGVIEGHKVLCGSTELMRLMNVRIPFRLTDKTTVLLAIDGILYGIFALHYEPLAQVRRALVELVRSSRHPVFAVRDFNINPEMLHNTFDIATDGYDFPPYAERFEMSTPTDDKNTRNIAAVICNEGLGPLTTVADVGRKMYVSARTNVFINVIAAIFGMFFVFVRFLSAGCLPLGALLVFMLFASLPVVLVSLYVNIKS